VEEWIAAGLNWEPVVGHLEIKELLPGIEIIALGPGHSFGMLALLVRLTETGNIILAADAAYCRENAGPPIEVRDFKKDSQAMFLRGFGWASRLTSV